VGVGEGRGGGGGRGVRGAIGEYALLGFNRVQALTYNVSNGLAPDKTSLGATGKKMLAPPVKQKGKAYHVSYGF